MGKGVLKAKHISFVVCLDPMERKEGVELFHGFLVCLPAYNMLHYRNHAKAVVWASHYLVNDMDL